MNRVCKKHLLLLNTPHRMPPFPPSPKPIRITVSTPSTRPVCSHPASRSAIAPPLSADNFPLLSICLYAFTRLPSTHTQIGRAHV